MQLSQLHSTVFKTHPQTFSAPTSMSISSHFSLVPAGPYTPEASLSPVPEIKTLNTGQTYSGHQLVFLQISALESLHLGNLYSLYVYLRRKIPRHPDVGKEWKNWAQENGSGATVFSSLGAGECTEEECASQMQNYRAASHV